MRFMIFMPTVLSILSIWGLCTTTGPAIPAFLRHTAQAWTRFRRGDNQAQPPNFLAFRPKILYNNTLWTAQSPTFATFVVKRIDSLRAQR